MTLAKGWQGQQRRMFGHGLDSADVCHESEIVYPGPSWVDGGLQPEEMHRVPKAAELRLVDVNSRQFAGRKDLYDDAIISLMVPFADRQRLQPHWV